MSASLFPERLRTLRQAHHLTQAVFARKLGLAYQGHISNLEAGRKAPSIDLIVRIADMFEVTTDYLLRGKEGTFIPISKAGVHASTGDNPPLFGAKLRHLRLRNNLLQVDLARDLGLARQGYVSNLETGRTEPSLDLVVRIANYFDISTDYLIRDTVAVEEVDPQVDGVALSDDPS